MLMEKACWIYNLGVLVLPKLVCLIFLEREVKGMRMQTDWIH